MRPAITFLNIQLSNSREERINTKSPGVAAPGLFVLRLWQGYNNSLKKCTFLDWYI